MRAVACIYQPEDTDKRNRRIIYKTLDPNIKVDDYVVVPTNTRHGMTVVKVVEVDFDIDLDTEKNIDWIIGAVDTESYELIASQEKEAIATIQAAEKQRKRQQLRESVLALQADKIKALPIADYSEAENTST